MISMKYYEWAFSRFSPTESLNSRVRPLLTQLHLQGSPAPAACGHCIRQQGAGEQRWQKMWLEKEAAGILSWFCKISKCYQNIRMSSIRPTVDRFLSPDGATGASEKCRPQWCAVGPDSCPHAHLPTGGLPDHTCGSSSGTERPRGTCGAWGKGRTFSVTGAWLGLARKTPTAATFNPSRHVFLPKKSEIAQYKKKKKNTRHGSHSSPRSEPQHRVLSKEAPLLCLCSQELLGPDRLLTGGTRDSAAPSSRASGRQALLLSNSEGGGQRTTGERMLTRL